MEKPFDFRTLPKEITAVLNDVIQWRLAMDADLVDIACTHARHLDKTSATFRDWCSVQGELHQMIIMPGIRETEVAVTQKRVPGRQERQRRIAKSALSLVEGDT